MHVHMFTHFSRVLLFVTAACLCQAMGFSRQERWIGKKCELIILTGDPAFSLVILVNFLYVGHLFGFCNILLKNLIIV